MLRNEFEDVLIQKTPYYKDLENTYRDTINFERYISILKKICEDDSFIEMFEKKGGKQLVYFGRKIFTLQKEFITHYVHFLSDESRIDKWDQFFERYSKNLFEIYEKFVAGDNNRILIFEIVNRKLLRDLLKQQTMHVPLMKKILISERLGVVVNQLFSYIRHSLADNMAVMDTLIVDSYTKIPLLPQCNHSETMKLLSKCFLEKGLPEPLFSAIFKNITTSYYTDTKDKIMAAISRTTFLNKDEVLKIFKSYFFFPDNDSLSEILKLLKTKAYEMIKIIENRKEMIERKRQDIKRKAKDTTKVIEEQLIDLTEHFSTEEPMDSMIKKLRANLITYGYDLKILKNEYHEFVKKEGELNHIIGYKTKDLLEFVFRNEWDSYIILSFNKNKSIADDQLQLLIKGTINEIRNNKTAMEVMNKYRIIGFLKERYNTNAINNKFEKIANEVIVPLVRTFLLEELIEYYPKLSDVTPSEGVRYLAEESLSGEVFMIEKNIKTVQRRSDVSALNILHYKNLASVLVYDIRGSTFMGTKLRDAKRESEIRNYFQQSMLSIVGRYGGIPIKDTGDGGVVLFAVNHYDIRNYNTIKLEPGSVLSAVRCGVEMVKGAKNFVQENIYKYQDWFREAEERKISFEGVTYATLLSSYQAIFQIGVGIASGVCPKEIYLDKNAFGELDLTGMLVREANLYSRVRAKEKSTIICDDATLFNLLLNVKKFSFLSEEGLRIDPLSLSIEQGLEYWMKQKVTKRGFILDLYKIFVKQLGQEVSRSGSLKILLGAFDIAIDETGKIRDEKGGRGKQLFEVSTKIVK